MASIHAPHAIQQKLQSRSERIVLQIEDNLANAEVVKQLLARRIDLKLQTATDGPQGIEMACSLLPNVILLDIRMPGMSGLEVLSILRGNPATEHIPVIALSSNAYPSEIKKCLGAGVFGYLTKPYKIDDLMALVDAAMCYASEKRLTTQCRNSNFEAAPLPNVAALCS